ncbi:MAG: hypothetical protein QOJ57_98, partial [Thermoleophilaceae bacterium]|nr:hypothetical protein [Thermoleophilaceae bacterium]
FATSAATLGFSQMMRVFATAF